MLLPAALMLVHAIDEPAAAAVQSPREASIFMAACLDGKAGFAPGDVTAIAFGQLPAALRKRLGKPSSSQVWQLNSPGHHYLYVLDYPPRRKVDSKVCGLASDTMSLDDAADAVQMRIAGNVYRARGQTLQLLMPKDGYTAISTKAGEFGILQINWLNEADRHAMQKTYESVTP